MTATMKYNPGFLSDDDLVASFCVRTVEFGSIMETLRECTADSNAHTIVIGPRGSGKTTLLLRAAAEIRRDDELASRLFPIVFSEESYEVGTCGEFWLECLAHLADQAPRRADEPDLRRSYDALRRERDDRALADRCLGALLDFADRENKRLALCVENLGMLFADAADADIGWRLRHTLQTEPRIIMLGSATSRFAQLDSPDEALYGFFRTLTLRPLGTAECATLWEAVSGQSAPSGTVRSMEILTGGSPRLLMVLARFGAGRSFDALMDSLFRLIDDHTDYFKNHLDALPPGERRVYLALADLWKPATAREVADRARFETNACSAQIKRLIQRGVVQEAGGTNRRKQYYITERLYNIYYLLRRRHGGADPLVEALVHFMSSYYSSPQLADIGARLADDTGSLNRSFEQIHVGFARHLIAAMEPPDRASYIIHLANKAPTGITNESSRRGGQRYDSIEESPGTKIWGRIGSEVAKPYLDGILARDRNMPLGHQLQSLREFIRACSPFQDNETSLMVAIARGVMGYMLVAANQPEAALQALDGAIREFESGCPSQMNKHFAQALKNRGMVLCALGRPDEALQAFDRMVHKFGDGEETEVRIPVVESLLGKAEMVSAAGDASATVELVDEVMRRFDVDAFRPHAAALASKMISLKCRALMDIGRVEEVEEAVDTIVDNFGFKGEPYLDEIVVAMLIAKTMTLAKFGRLEEGLKAIERLIDGYNGRKEPVSGIMFAQALSTKGLILWLQNQWSGALQVIDEALAEFNKTGGLNHKTCFPLAVMMKANVLRYMDRGAEAVRIIDNAVKCLEQNHDANSGLVTGMVLMNNAGLLEQKAKALAEMGKLDEALDIFDDIMRQIEQGKRFGGLQHRGILGNLKLLQVSARNFLLDTARREIESRHFDVALAWIESAMGANEEASPIGIRALGLRAVARYEGKQRSAWKGDVSEILAQLRYGESVPAEVIENLIYLSRRSGPESVLKLIEESSAESLLLPLSTALRRRMGERPRVAREVDEVANDILRDLSR